MNRMNTAYTSQFSVEDPLIDMTFITTFTGMTDKWFYKLIKDGDFPKPIKLGRSSRWFKSEVETWMQQRITQSRPESLVTR
ncbi:TPA: helix-turn-helix transcriptional regulator [Yersinia enterocolitica]|nr:MULTISPECIES: AlpA family transcriptional regulator [Yersinia]CNL41948.1 AlpA family protein [Yersinia intermedia]HDL7103770.1 AlpA family transcriptional regulator [Yersinia enterocolitica]HDL7346985.1 AlpA family transcriptional regulator [Yersinia enterocolitica]HDL7952162.1 AlpA family transcriptional regulator [Yersinia enterocolitica]HED4493102.1 AlpA family transcriptional regulator [Yersinia enterocolitica]